MKKLFTKKTFSVTVSAVAFILFGFVSPATAQISSISASYRKEEMKQSKRDAKKYDAEHKETHLDLSSVPVKTGESGRKSKKIEEMPTNYSSDSEINALVEQKQPRIKLKKKLFFRNKSIE